MDGLFLHQHYLLFDRYEKQEATCDKCNRQIDGLAYNCESCNFWLHDSCAKQKLPSPISHPLHSQHSLFLAPDPEIFNRLPKREKSRLPKRERSYFEFVCQGCSTLSDGLRYTCRDCHFVIDVLCASNTEDDVLGKQGRRSDGMYKKTAHFIHEDDLIPFEYRKVKSYHYSCKWCDKFLSGMCYGRFRLDCKKKKFFVHESCLLSIPTTILKHPFHPTHPLSILSPDGCSPCNACGHYIEARKYKKKNKAYHCPKCEFWVHVLCAKPAGQPSLKHDFHEHSLSYIELDSDIPRNFKCNLCDKFIRGHDYDKRIRINDKLMRDVNYIFNTAIYRCVLCGVNLHLGCVPVPLITEHGYHRHALRLVRLFIEDNSGEYYCDICEEERNQIQPVYCCEECKYITHIQCALNKGDSKALMPKSMEQEETGPDNAESDQSQIEYFAHRHSLQFYEIIGTIENIRCKACDSEITNQAYGCESCKFYLDKTCAKLSHKLLHPLHLQHTLYLVADRERFLCCQCRDYTIGYFYKCYPCDFTLDVKCAISTTPKNESQRLKEIERQSMLCFRCQHQELSFFNYRYQTGGYMGCSICGQFFRGPTYKCYNCGYMIHESCFGFPREIQLPILQEYPLHPIVINSSYCCACRCLIPFGSIVYSCGYRQSEHYLEFHLQCANSLRRAIKVDLHEHPLFYFGTECQKLFSTNAYALCSFKCHNCNNPRNGVPFFRCLVCDINLHLKCVPMPLSIKSKCHIHLFSLKESYVEDDSGEYYCDVCEEERHQEDYVYYCEECHGLFVAHIECVLNQAEGTAPMAEASSALEVYFERWARKRIITG